MDTASSTPRTLELKPSGHTMVSMTPAEWPLLTITFAAPPVTGNGERHLELKGQTIKCKRKSESTARLDKVKWERKGMKGMKLVDKDKAIVAEFGTVGNGNRSRGCRALRCAQRRGYGDAVGGDCGYMFGKEIEDEEGWRVVGGWDVGGVHEFVGLVGYTGA
ncbi:uncharacterized protein BCR38DRAFT_490236 [Pseudomassariella vexata]|uniref:Uncharacterized protein n=1 Tax=Pseudomassariella vexata TaxID=1141098 RepID=A0A1Y2DDF6_9PEZI|nr:uncharacterized protein BCR38DRAFT_490236 [Pseudomassariella vexata]ORY57269.1 hypothetical protein BCR38DRAFT_490236 [Pseudomassariella vexata]